MNLAEMYENSNRPLMYEITREDYRSNSFDPVPIYQMMTALGMIDVMSDIVIIDHINGQNIFKSHVRHTYPMRRIPLETVRSMIGYSSRLFGGYWRSVVITFCRGRISLRYIHSYGLNYTLIDITVVR